MDQESGLECWHFCIRTCIRNQGSSAGISVRFAVQEFGWSAGPGRASSHLEGRGEKLVCRVEIGLDENARHVGRMHPLGKLV
jgi:hypothetical protein